MGATNRTDSEASELLPHIRNLITDTFNLSQLSTLNTDGLMVTKKDIIFLEDASTIRADDENALTPIRHAFFNRNATIAAIYPDAEDVKALGNILGVNLAGPDNEPNTKHYEIVAASMRYVSGDTLPHKFIYIDKCTENRVTLTGIYQLPENLPASIDVDPSSWDEYFGEEVTTPNAEELAARTRDYDANYDLLLAERVQKVIDWSNGIDDTVAAHKAEIMSQASALAFAVADNTNSRADEIMKFVGGVHTDFSDSSYMHCFYDYDYARRHGSQADTWNKWADYSGCNDYGTLKDHWNSFTPGVDISVTQVTYSVHSYADHSDYYLITTSSTIQPRSLEIRAAYGDTTGGEVKGSGAYHYAVVLGSNKKVQCYLWPNLTGTELLKLTPSQTVNHDHTFSDTDGWSMGGGVSGGGHIERGTSSKDAQTGFGGNLSGSFNYSVSHSATNTWGGSDYDITPKRGVAEDGSGIPVIGWVVDVIDPSYSSSKGWQITQAAKHAVTLDGESIWRVLPENVNNPGFTTQAHWSEGFYAAHEMAGMTVSRANCTIDHSTGKQAINLSQPMRFGLANVVTAGTSEGKMYTAKVYSEMKWTASSNADWLTLSDTSKSGGVSDGENFIYTVAPNTTGGTRTGTITVKTDDDNTYTLIFTQSPYAK